MQFLHQVLAEFTHLGDANGRADVQVRQVESVLSTLRLVVVGANDSLAGDVLHGAVAAVVEAWVSFLDVIRSVVLEHDEVTLVAFEKVCVSTAVATRRLRGSGLAGVGHYPLVEGQCLSDGKATHGSHVCLLGVGLDCVVAVWLSDVHH